MNQSIFYVLITMIVVMPCYPLFASLQSPLHTKATLVCKNHPNHSKQPLSCTDDGNDEITHDDHLCIMRWIDQWNLKQKKSGQYKKACDHAAPILHSLDPALQPQGSASYTNKEIQKRNS